MKKLAVLTLAVSVCFLIGSCTTAETTAVVQKTVFDCSASKECLMPSAYVVDGDNNCYTVDLESRCLECVSLTDGGYQRYPLPDTLGDSGRLFAQIVDGDVYFVIADNLTRLVFLHRFDTDTREITKLNISITPTFAIGNGKVYTVDYTNEILLSKDLETLAVAKVTPEGKKDGCLESPICVNQEKLYFWKNKYGVAVLSCIDLATGEEHETKVKEEDLHLIKLAQVYDQYVAYYYAKGLSNNIITYYGTRLCSLSTGERIDLEDPLAKPCVFFGDALYYWKDAGDDVLAAYDLNTGVTTRTDAVSTSSNWTKAFLSTPTALAVTDTSSRSITPVAGADDIAIANLDVENPYSMYGVRVLAGQLANAFAGDYAGNTDSLKEDLVRMITENDQKAVFVVISDTGSRVITDSIGKADFAGYENAEAAESGDEILSVELVVIVNQSHEAVTEYSDGTHFYNTVSRVTVVDAAQNKVLWMQTFDDGQKGDYIKTYVGSSADTYGYDPFLQQIRDLLADGNTTLDHVGKLYQKFVK